MRRLLLGSLASALLLWSGAVFAGFDEGMAAFQRKDYAAALAEFQPLARAGDAEALAQIGVMHAQGWGVPKDAEKALGFFQTAAAKGSSKAMVFLGNFSRFGMAGQPKDAAKAAEWYRKAAQTGNNAAMNNLGQMYLSGDGVARDPAQAALWFQQAVDKGNALAERPLALLLWNGTGVTKDRARAFPILKKAADAGDADSQAKVGLALLSGDGAPRNPEEGATYLRKAAEAGEHEAQYALGQAYRGGAGVARSPFQAYQWLSVAASRAPAGVKAQYEQARDEAAISLTPGEVAHVQELTRMWKPRKAAGTEALTTAPDTVAPARPAPSPSPAPAAASPAPTPTPVKRQASAGSGFVVAGDGMVLTNSHVVPAACKTIKVTTTEGRSESAALSARDEANDLALLKTSLRGTEVARFREDKPLRSGDAVVAVGYPLSSLLSREPNVTAGVVSALAGIRGDQRHYQITAPVQKGNSGGPLADNSGNVVGVVSSKLNAMKIAGMTGDLPQNINFAIKADLARKFLSDNGIRPATAPSPETLSAADVGERIKRVTVFVECQG